MNTSNLFKYRSVTACMKASYDLLSDNITSLLKKTWWAVLALSVAMSLLFYFRMPNLALHNWGEANPWSSFLIQTFIYLAYIVLVFFAGAVLWNWLNEKGIKTNLLRFFFSIIIFALLIGILCAWCPSLNLMHVAKATLTQKATTSTYVFSAILGILNIIVAFVCLVPFGYIVPKCMIRESGEPIRAWAWFKCGLRHSGAIFKMIFLGCLIISILYLIISIPCMLIGYVQLKSQLGALDGDPLGTPSYFVLLFLVVFILTNFLYIYLGTWIGFSLAYLTGSIETQEKEKREKLEEIAMNSANVPTQESSN